MNKACPCLWGIFLSFQEINGERGHAHASARRGRHSRPRVGRRQKDEDQHRGVLPSTRSASRWRDTAAMVGVTSGAKQPRQLLCRAGHWGRPSPRSSFAPRESWHLSGLRVLRPEWPGKGVGRVPGSVRRGSHCPWPMLGLTPFLDEATVQAHFAKLLAQRRKRLRKAAGVTPTRWQNRRRNELLSS